MVNFKKYFTIKVRILLTFFLLCGLAIYNFSDWISNSARQHYLEAAEELMIDQLIHFKSMVLANTAVDAQQPNFEVLKKVVKELKGEHPQAKIYGVVKDTSDMQLYFTDTEGIILWHSDESFIGQDHSNWRNIFYALNGKYGARATRKVKEDPETSTMHVSHPLYKDQRLIGTVSISKPVNRLSEYLAHTRDRVLKQTILTLVLFLGLGYILMKRIVDPIERLTAYVDKIRNKENVPLPKLPQGELTLLGQTIDDMRTEIDGKNYIESYIEGMTHELKSPISAIQGASELIEVEEESDNQRLLKNIKKESQRMGEMIEQLLMLSRLENSTIKEQFEKFDLSELIVGFHRDFCERHSGRKILLNCPDGVEFQGDKSLISTAVQNLINNALEFSEANQDIFIELGESKSAIEITVTDHGSGIPDYALDKVFEKFYSLPRPDSGRKSSGLGLSITRQIAQMHGGDVELKSEGERTVAKLRLSF